MIPIVRKVHNFTLIVIVPWQIFCNYCDLQKEGNKYLMIIISCGEPGVFVKTNHCFFTTNAPTALSKLFLVYIIFRNSIFFIIMLSVRMLCTI